MILDTHALLWWLLDDPRLPTRLRDRIQQAESVLVSSVSGWEIAIKHRLGKLGLEPWQPAELPQLLVNDGFEVLPVFLQHALGAGALPRVHGDPFDRLIVAQAMFEGLPVVTSDPVFRAYGVDVIW